MQIYNGSDYDVTSITIWLTDKKTKEQRAYRYNQFIQYYRGPGFLGGFPAPQYRRFIKSLTHGEYVFPLEFPGVSQEDFFRKYEVTRFTAHGVDATPIVDDIFGGYRSPDTPATTTAPLPPKTPQASEPLRAGGR